MSITFLRDCGIFVSGYEFTGESNQVSVSLNKAQLPRNAFGDLSARYGHGLPKASVAVAGYLSAANRAQLTANWGDLDIPVSIIYPNNAGDVAIGNTALFFYAGSSDLEDGGTHGADMLFGMALQSSGNVGYKPLHGYCLNTGRTAVTADGGSTGYSAGAVSASQYIYGILHVTSVSASDSIVVKIQSAATGDTTFTTPTDVITFTSKSAIGAQIAVRVAGPSTNTLWRAYHDVTGSDVSIKYACCMAIR
jgi:hypothetical protein